MLDEEKLINDVMNYINDVMKSCNTFSYKQEMLKVINTCIHLYNPSCFLYNFLFLRRTILMCKSIHRQRYKGLVLKSCGKKSTFQIIRYRKN